MRRPSFLTLFFIGLSAAFVIVLAVRLRRDSEEQLPAPRVPASAPAAPQSSTITRMPDATSRPAPAVRRRERSAERVPEPQAVPVPMAQSRPPKPPSILTRALAPVVRLLTGGNPGAAKPSGTANAPQSARTSSAADAQTSTDPNSDTTPPRLLSIEFVPPQIHDGEDSTVVITATDDLSGIRGISGTIASPTGKALQGFAVQHEGDSNRYVGRVAIPKNAEQGIWRVRFLNLADNASNSLTLSDLQGSMPPTAVLRVISSDSDSTPPTLRNIWVDRRAMRGGEKNIVYVDAVDDNSGVSLVSTVFQSPSKLARIGAGCQRGDGDVWRCELSVPACLDCGDWQLEQVTLEDKANNLVTFRQDNPIVQAVKINIQGDSCDNTPPVLQSLVLDNNNVIVGERGAIVTVTIAATDDACGLSSASGQYSGPGAGSGGVFPLQRSGDGNWVGRIQLDPHAARGVWRINSIQLSDRGFNLRVYYGSDPLLQNGVFHVR